MGPQAPVFLGFSLAFSSETRYVVKITISAPAIRVLHRSSAVFKKSKFPDGFSSIPCTRLEYTIKLSKYQR